MISVHPQAHELGRTVCTHVFRTLKLNNLVYIGGVQILLDSVSFHKANKQLLGIMAVPKSEAEGQMYTTATALSVNIMT